MNPLKHFFNLFFPNLCLSCQGETTSYEDILCLKCLLKLPKTNFHTEKENPFTDRFWGRIALQNGAALYHFVKGGRTQQLIFQLKYNGRKDIGTKLGRLYGRQLKESPFFEDIDLVLPVPLHPKKERQRGYNQSLYFAKGLAEALGSRLDSKTLIRTKSTNTQTKKSREQRFENVLDAFEIQATNKWEGKHVLLVDDVITTGATLEACGLRLLAAYPKITLSMATIAIANL